MQKFVTYVLHFDRPKGRAQHYIGSCKADRLGQRMIEHRRGLGSAFTRAFFGEGIGATLAALEEGDDRSAELRLKSVRPRRRACPICMKGEPIFPIQRLEPLPQREPLRTDTGLLNWTSKADPTESGQ